jgi:hypothetical protein
MVEKWCPYDGGCIGHRSRERDIFLARSRIAARVVVDQNERARGFAEGHANWIARRDVKPVDAAGGHPARSAKTVVTIEREEPEFFVVERREPGTRPRFDRGSVGDPSDRLRRSRENGTPPELHGCGQSRAFGRPHARTLS